MERGQCFRLFGREIDPCINGTNVPEEARSGRKGWVPGPTPGGLHTAGGADEDARLLIQTIYLSRTEAILKLSV